jgi:hypothetical protein
LQKEPSVGRWEAGFNGREQARNLPRPPHGHLRVDPSRLGPAQSSAPFMGIPVSRRGMRLFNHLIGAHAWRRWHREPEPLAVLALISNSCLVARTGNSPGLSPRRTYSARCVFTNGSGAGSVRHPYARKHRGGRPRSAPHHAPAACFKRVTWSPLRFHEMPGVGSCGRGAAVYRDRAL